MAPDETKKGILQRHQSLIQNIYAVITGITLLTFLQIMSVYWEPSIRPSQAYVFPAWIWFLRVTAVVAALLSGKLRKDRDVILLVGYLLLMFFRAFFAGSSYLFSGAVSNSILNGVWVFIACYGLGRILDHKQLRIFVASIGTLWTIGMTASSCIGIYAAWNGKHIFNLTGGAYWGLFANRLFMIYLPTVSGAILSLSILIATVFIVAVRSPWIRIGFLLAAIIMLIASGLTDSRTGFITTAIGIAGILAIYAASRMNLTGRWKRITIPGILFIITFLGITVLLTRIPGLFNRFRTTGSVILPTALAEGEALTEDMVTSRGFSGSDLLSGRMEIWQTALEYILHRPLVLLFGTTKEGAMAGINLILGDDMAHCHNMLLMIFLESGITGLIIIMLFLSRTIISGIRLIRDRSRPLWLRLLPPIVLSMLVGDLVECYLWLKTITLPMISFAFVMMGIINVYGEKTNADKDNARR